MWPSCEGLASKTKSDYERVWTAIRSKKKVSVAINDDCFEWENIK